LADGTYTFTPDSGYVGPVSFVYEVIDSRGAKASATIYFTVNAIDILLGSITLKLNGTHIQAQNQLALYAEHAGGFDQLTLYRRDATGSVNTMNTYSNITTDKFATAYIDKLLTTRVNYYYFVGKLENGTYAQSNTVRLEAPFYSDLVVYPSPTTSSVTVAFNATIEDGYIIKVTDARGRLVMFKDGRTTIGDNTVALDLSAHAAGNYFVVVELNGEARHTVKIQKK
jgi:hypothetical protein